MKVNKTPLNGLITIEPEKEEDRLDVLYKKF